MNFYYLFINIDDKGVQNKLINVDETIYITFTNTELFCWHAIFWCKLRPTLFLWQPSIGGGSKGANQKHQEGKFTLITSSWNVRRDSVLDVQSHYTFSTNVHIINVVDCFGWRFGGGKGAEESRGTAGNSYGWIWYFGADHLLISFSHVPPIFCSF